MSQLKTVSDMELYELFSLIYLHNMDTKMGEDVIPLYYPGTEEEIYEGINKFYMEENGESLLINDHNKEILYKFAKERSRYLFLNDIMNDLLGKLVRIDFESEPDCRDYFLATNLMEMLKIIRKEIKNTLNNKNSEYCKLTRISHDEADRYVIQILYEIDPTGKWAKIYNDLVLSGGIIYLDELTDEEITKLEKRLGCSGLKEIQNACIMTNDGRQVIMLSSMGTIREVGVKVHEIMHYIGNLNSPDKEIVPTLDEFFSIFYQLYAIKFLEKIGYSQKEINSLRMNVYDAASIIPKTYVFFVWFWHYIKILNNNLEITEKEDIINCHNSKRLAYFLCNGFTENLLLNAEIIFMKYKYIIGLYLAKLGIDKLEDSPDVLPLIKGFMDNISEVSAYDLFSLVGALDSNPEIKPIDNEIESKSVFAKKRKIKDE